MKRNCESCWVSILFLPPVEIWFEVINLSYNEHTKLHNIVNSTLLSTMLSFFASLNYCETTSSTMNSISKREYSLLKVSINCCFVRYSKDSLILLWVNHNLFVHSFVSEMHSCSRSETQQHIFISYLYDFLLLYIRIYLSLSWLFYWWISYVNVILKLKTCLGFKKLDIQHKFIDSFNLRNSNALRINDFAIFEKYYRFENIFD
jgi:hypothetical protein